MRLLTILVLVTALFGGYRWWQDRGEDEDLSAIASPNGFVPVEMPGGVPRTLFGVWLYGVDNPVRAQLPADPGVPDQQQRPAGSAVPARAAGAPGAAGPTETAAHARREIEAINASADFHEGIAAFVDKRAPVFGGH